MPRRDADGRRRACPARPAAPPPARARHRAVPIRCRTRPTPRRAHAAVDAGRNASATRPPAERDAADHRPRSAAAGRVSACAPRSCPTGKRRDDDRARDRRPSPHDHEEEHRQEERADERAVQREETGVGDSRVDSFLGARRPLDRAHTRHRTPRRARAQRAGACSRKMLRQLKSWVRKPPSAGPTATPIVPASPHSRMACSSLPRIAESTGTAPTSAIAAPRPCTVRPTMSMPNDVERPHHSDATANDPKPEPGEHGPAYAPLDREDADGSHHDREVVRGDRPRHGDDRDVERRVEIRAARARPPTSRPRPVRPRGRRPR